jgi:UDP-glucose 4-epimerase
MSKFLVTGGAGFIGSHLVHKLVALGHEVRVLDNLSTGRRENLDGLAGPIEWVQANAADPGDVEKAMRGIEGVFHLAAVPSVHLSIAEPLKTQQSAEVATLVVLDAARRAGVKRVVYSSSCAVYGDSGNQCNKEDTKTHPLTFYGLSKVTGEEYCRISSHLYSEFDTVSLRYFNVFGSRQSPSSPYSGVISIFLKCLRDGTPPTIFGDGEQTRDFIEVSNVVTANLSAMNSAIAFRGDCYNVGTGTSISILELWNFAADLAHSKLKPQFGESRAGDIRYSCSDITKIRKGLGWQPEVDWKKGLAVLWNETKAGNRS